MHAEIAHNRRQESSIAFAVRAEWETSAIENFLILNSGDVDVTNNMN
jgi:hypothetical protein